MYEAVKKKMAWETRTHGEGLGVFVTLMSEFLAHVLPREINGESLRRSMSELRRKKRKNEAEKGGEGEVVITNVCDLYECVHRIY